MNKLAFGRTAGDVRTMLALGLIDCAKALPDKSKYPTDTILGAVQVMRSKGYTYREIHRFLKDKGVRVHPVSSTFTSVMSRRMKRQRMRAIMEDDDD